MVKTELLGWAYKKQRSILKLSDLHRLGTMTCGLTDRLGCLSCPQTTTATPHEAPDVVEVGRETETRHLVT